VSAEGVNKIDTWEMTGLYLSIPHNLPTFPFKEDPKASSNKTAQDEQKQKE
jgi:hypothetical protein